jgi:acyl-CoA synthetase (AMP-forming)/AMP-acid ligase II/aryl carrier-like protein
MLNSRTLVDALEANCANRSRVTFLESESEARDLSCISLYERALGILHRLQALGAARGDKLILLLGNNEKFLEAFWGAILGGIVPVPLSLDTNDYYRDKLLRIVKKLGKPFIFTERRALERVRAYAKRTGTEQICDDLDRRALLIEDGAPTGRGERVPIQPEDVAFIQFSSGSTSEPKGVVLTHANLMANIRGLTLRAELSSADISLSWMPLSHDFGLIGFYLMMFANSIHVHLMPTDLFVRRPVLWIQLASRVRASLLASPNFGYRHLLKALGVRPIEGLDLSAVRLIYNGAEPISPVLCREFLARLRPTKLKEAAMYPVYGLAEGTVGVSLSEPGAPLQTIKLDRHRMGVGMAVEPLQEMTRNTVELVCEGTVVPYCELRVSGDDDTVLPQGCIGHVQIKGASVMSGYYENPDATAAVLTPDGWLRTGDLGVIFPSGLYICGRSKEIIILNGQNYYPHDIEAIAEKVPRVEFGRVAAVGVPGPDDASEQLALFVVHRGDAREFLPTVAGISLLVNQHTNLEVRFVVPIKRMPRTTSGKLQRTLLKERFLAGEFDTVLQELAAARAERVPAIAARSVLEERLKGICEKILHVALDGRPIDVRDNLFEIGVGSIVLVQIHKEIDREHPGKISLGDLYQLPTIADLAQHLSDGPSLKPQSIARDFVE